MSLVRFFISCRLLASLLIGSVLFAAQAELRAHGDDQVLIEALSEELAKQPDADLFIRRGELFRHQREWVKAEADFASAARMEPELAIVDFFRSRTFLEAGEPEKARTFVDRYLARDQREAEGWFLRGDVLAALGQHDAGALEYAEGLRRAPHPRPEHYLRRARFLAAAPNAEVGRVLAALDDGMDRLGPIIALLEYAITLEIDRKNYDAALTRIAKAMEFSPRREVWLVRQGDILVKTGRIKEAVASYRAALAAIEELPPRYRETVPMEKLERDARQSLETLATTSGEARSPTTSEPAPAQLR